MLVDASLEADIQSHVVSDANTRLCRPAKGRSLGATVVTFARPIHRAVQRLVANARPNIAATPLYEFLNSRESAGVIAEPAAERLAWFAVNVALLHAICLRSLRVSRVADALEWFFRDYDEYASTLTASFQRDGLDDADSILRSVLVDARLMSLLPYVLEPHGHVSRGALERDAIAHERRRRKRHAGIYYTPSDIAEFMVAALVDPVRPVTWIDPACGTAVFLREIIRHCHGRGVLSGKASALEFCKAYVYGLDISALATESCAFVVVAECALREDISQPSPFDSWQLISKNIRACDATLLSLNSTTFHSLSIIPDAAESVDLRTLFPGTGGIFDRVVMNPPYSSLVIDHRRKTTWDSFHGITFGSKGNAAVPFVEMLWKLAKADGAGSAVLPLSIAVSSHGQFKACRRAIKDSGGLWEFLFFDREPHALFGEDIKTRNAIVFRQGSFQPLEIKTSRMLKWTSASRPNIFTRSRTTPLPANVSIEDFVPKVGTAIEATLYENLKGLRKGKGLSFHLSRTTLSQLALLDDARTVVVSSSAYNFLNTFPPSALSDITNVELSESPLHVLVFAAREQRDIALSILASSLAFWLWHLEGDGFHVTADFLARLPLWNVKFDDTRDNTLSELGRAAWTEAVGTRFKSLNGGKATYSFQCPYDSEIVRAIDNLLITAVGVPRNALAAIAEFIDKTVSIDGAKRRRVAPQETIGIVST